MLSLLLLAACQEPFDVTRKELGPFRIAAVGVQDGRAQAAIWSGLGLYHEVAPTLRWTLDGVALGEGWEVDVATGGLLGLTVESPDGVLHSAELTAAEGPARPGVSRAAVAVGQDLRVDTRAALEERAVDTTVAAGEATRLRLDAPDGPTLRWMTAQGLGTLLELDARAADVLAEEVVTDDDAVLVSRTPLDPGLFPQLALLLDGAGGNTWLWADAAVGVDEPLVRHEGRLIPADEAPTPGLYAATLGADEGPAGLRLSDLTAVEPGDLSAADPLPCAPSGEPFRVAWVAEGRCPRPDVDGARVVLELW